MMQSSQPDRQSNGGILSACFAPCCDNDDALADRDQIDLEVAANQNNLGLQLQEQGNFAEAIKAYEKSIDADPTYAEAYFNLGSVLHEMEDLEGAEANFLKTISLDSRHPQAHYNLGYVYQEQQRLEESIEQFQKSKELDSSNVDTWVSFGVVCKLAGRWDEAEAGYQEALKLHPESVITTYNLAKLEYDRRKVDTACLGKARDLYLRVLQLDPSHADAAFNVAIAYQEQGDFINAIKYYEMAGSLDPSIKEAVESATLLRKRLDKQRRKSQEKSMKETPQQGVPKRKSGKGFNFFSR